MRSIVLILVSIATTALAAGPAAPKTAPGPAPDPLVVANDNYKVVLENDQVRVMEHTVQMGAGESTHRMPCRVSYAMSGFKMVTQNPDGPRTEAVRQPRVAWWSGAESLALKNNGNAVARELIVEFKQPLPGATDCTSVGTQAVISVVPSAFIWSTDAAKVARASVFGDPAAEGPYAQRIRLPAGYKSGKRAFDRELSTTVLGGEIKVSFGEGLAVQTLPAGSYLRIPAGVVHEAWSERGAELEQRGVGPVAALQSAAPSK